MKTIADQIDEARDLCAQSDTEVRRCKQALALAEAVCADRHATLGELLEKREREQFCERI